MRVSVVGKFDFLIDEKYVFLTEMFKFRIVSGYVVVTVNKTNLGLVEKFGIKVGQTVKLHRLIYMLESGIILSKKQLIDHRDLDKLNNKLENLRVVTQSQNNKNRNLKEGQIYYNIGYNKFFNRFKFSHQEVGHQRCFNNLEHALAYFKRYNEDHDFILTKHIHNPMPIEEVEHITIHPPLICECGASLNCEYSLKRHKKNTCPL